MNQVSMCALGTRGAQGHVSEPRVTANYLFLMRVERLLRQRHLLTTSLQILTIFIQWTTHSGHVAITFRNALVSVAYSSLRGLKMRPCVAPKRKADVDWCKEALCPPPKWGHANHGFLHLAVPGWSPGPTSAAGSCVHRYRRPSGLMTVRARGLGLTHGRTQ